MQTQSQNLKTSMGVQKKTFKKKKILMEKIPNQDWIPITKLGRLVKQKKIKSLEEIFYFSLPIKEEKIIDFFLNDKIKDEVLKIMPVQKQTRAGQRTRFKAFLIVGDFDKHIGLGIKTAKEVASAIKGALVIAKLSMIPSFKGFWGEKIGKSHTIPMKVTGKCGSIRFRCVPAPKGTGIVAAKIPKKLLTLAGYEDIFTTSKGQTRTFGNFAKATFNAIYLTQKFITPKLWSKASLVKNPMNY